MLAGVVALIIEACPSLLMQTISIKSELARISDMRVAMLRAKLKDVSSREHR